MESVLLPILVGIGLLIGLILSLTGLLWGWHGKRVDDHPLCRRCGFDLTGRPEGSAQCAECGANLTGPKAVRVGHRVKRRGVLVGSLAVMLLCFAVIAFGVTIVARQISPWEFAPRWYVDRSVLTAEPFTRWKAISETQRRMKLTGAMAADFRSLIDQLLVIQGDNKKPWAGVWGDLIDTGLAAGVVSPEQEKQYYRQLAIVTVACRPQVQAGALVPLNVAWTLRGNTSGHFDKVGYRLHLARTHTGSSLTSYSSNGGFSSGQTHFEADPLVEGVTGFSGYLELFKPSSVLTTRYDAPIPPADLYVHKDIGQTFRPLVNDDPLTAVTDPDLAKSVAKTFRASMTIQTPPRGKQMLSGTLQANGFKVLLAYDVYLVLPTENRLMGTVTIVPATSGSIGGWGIETLMPAEPLDNARLLLVPSEEAVRSTVEHSSYLNVPFELSGIKITRSATNNWSPPTAPTVRPTTRPDPATTRPRQWDWRQ